MPKATVTLSDGTTQEVEHSAISLADGHHLLSTAQLDHRIKTRLGRERSRVQQEARKFAQDPAYALDDESQNAYFGTLLSDVLSGRLAAQGLSLNDDGTVKMPEAGEAKPDPAAVQAAVAAQLEAEKKKWLSEIQGDLDSAKADRKLAEDMIGQTIIDQIIESARKAGVKEDKFDYIPNENLPYGGRENMPVVANTRHLVDFARDKREVAVIQSRDASGNVDFAFSTGGNGRTYKGPAGLFADWKADKDLAPKWFDETKPPGPTNLGGTGGGGSQGDKSDMERLMEYRHRQ